MSESDSVVAFVPHQGGSKLVADVIGRWFPVADTRRPNASLPWHVVGCQADAALGLRDLVAMARQAYAAGATEVWLVPAGAHTSGRLMPRLLSAA